MTDDREDIGYLKGKLEALEKDVALIRGDLKMLVDAANMGKGAWWVSVKIGAVIIGVLSVAAWILEHIPKFK